MRSVWIDLFEHMFDTGRVSRAALIEDLRAKVRRLEGRPQAASLTVHPALSGMLDLQAGHAYTVDSATLAMLVMAGPSSRDGAWCAVVGAADFGTEAAQSFGVVLERTVLVPDPGQDWLAVVSALVDVVSVVVVAGRDICARDAQRMAARLYERQSIIIAWDCVWPRARAHVRLTDVLWHGVQRGNGHLQAREATIEVQQVGHPAVRRRFWLPDGEQRVRAIESSSSQLRSVS